jgi:hypothetical protein
MFANNSYAEFRARATTPALREDSSGLPPEQLLQIVWQHQRLLREQLRTLDGETVRVLHPGFRNREAGPDFRGAVVQFGSELPRSGDVEIDLQCGGWRAHGHHTNPAFEKVILHVVWNGDTARNKIPTLPIRGLLDAPLNELTLWLTSEGAQHLPENFAGKCSAPLRNLSEPQLQSILREAAKVRLQAKATRIRARAKQAGWEQALWEELFRALGYKHNVWPMQRLAELRTRWADSTANLLRTQSRLFGIAGFLPTEVKSRSENYPRRMWDIWWRERDEFADCLLPRSVWRFNGLRPANHPQRRLALASHWLSAENLPDRLEQWCAEEIEEQKLFSSLANILKPRRDEFWSWHSTFSSARLTKPQLLLGEGRVADLAINAILPWLWIRAAEGKNSALKEKIEQRYFAWPSAEDNSLLKLARQRLLGGTTSKWFRTAALQQGLLQITRDFCEHANSLCESCPFPDLVRQWNR